jgi:membrane protease YdiL (CAAX protease family)
MSLWRKILRFPVTRIGVWAALTGLGSLLLSSPLGRLTMPYGELGRYAGMTISGLLALLFVGFLVERRPLAGFGLGLRSAVRDTLAGFVMAAFLMTAIIKVMQLAGWYRPTAFVWDGKVAVIALIYFLMVGILEEVAMRGVLFRIVEESLGSWISLGLSAVIFGLMHLGNENASLTAALSIAAEAGILLAAAYMLTRSLWMAVGMHWGWNYVQGTVFGAAVSGGGGPSLIHASIDGPAVLTGGAFGPEAGLVALAIGTAAGVWLLVLAARRGHIIPPVWRRPPEPQPAADGAAAGRPARP